MKYRLFIAIIFLFPVLVSAQASDFIVLKRKGRTIKNYYSGTMIEFVSVTGAYRNGLINNIQNDSLFIQEFIIRYIPTTIGTYITDTVGSFRYNYHFNEILSIGPPAKKGFNVHGSGASLFGGGVLLSAGSGVVYLVDRKNFSPLLLSASAGLAALGYLLMKSGSKGIVPGKKGYVLKYMDMTP